MGLCAPQTPSISSWKLFLNKVSSLTYDGINTFMFCQANQEAIESNTINTWYKIFDEMNRRTTTKKDNIYNISRRLICFNLLSCEKCYHQELYLTVSAYLKTSLLVWMICNAASRKECTSTPSLVEFPWTSSCAVLTAAWDLCWNGTESVGTAITIWPGL